MPASDRAVFIGTSGWNYKHWLGPFYPPGLPARNMLAWYAERFDTVELNNTFYRLPTENAVSSWRSSSPENFRFAVKGSRFLTHMKKLRDPEAGIARFFERMSLLGDKIGPVLFQLPPFWEADCPRLDAFLAALPPDFRYAFEFRNETWNNEEVLATLRKHNAGYCIFDLAGYRSPLTVTADLVYIRLHGPGGKYQGSYPDPALHEWASRIKAWRAESRTIYVYFDNDDSGHAPANALRLRELTETE